MEVDEQHGDPRFHQLLDQYGKLYSRKNRDYAASGSAGGTGGNFVRCAAIKSLYPGMDWATPFGVAISYMLKQLDAAMVLASTGQDSVNGEPVPARLQDVVVYTTIASTLWDDAAKKEVANRSV